MPSESAGSGVAGPVGFIRPGPPGRLLLAAAGALVSVSAAGLTVLQQPTGTMALFTSRAAPQTNTIVAGDWTPDPPLRCTGKYVGVVYGTMADDVIHGGNHPQIIMGVGGDDTIYAGNSGDCLVGGDGNDRLVGGNGKDILLGGPGKDYLEAGDARDAREGETRSDECEGGNGNDTSVHCESAARVATTSDSPTATLGGTS